MQRALFERVCSTASALAPVERLADGPTAPRPRCSAASLGQSDTTIRREHRFADTSPPGVPRARRVQDYETLRRYVDRQRRTGRRAHHGAAGVLCADERFHGTPKVHSGHVDDARGAPRRAGVVHLPAVSRVPAAFGQGARDHGRGGGGPARLGSCVGSVSGHCTRRCLVSCGRGSSSRRRCPGSPTTI